MARLTEPEFRAITVPPASPVRAVASDGTVSNSISLPQFLDVFVWPHRFWRQGGLCRLEMFERLHSTLSNSSPGDVVYVRNDDWKALCEVALMPDRDIAGGMAPSYIPLMQSIASARPSEFCPNDNEQKGMGTY